MAGPTTGKGISAISELLSPQRDVSIQVQELATTKLPQIFHRAVVVEVLYDLQQFTPQKILDIEKMVSNPLFVRFVPRNAIIARLVSGGQDRSGAKPILLYPFFSPHFNIPIKPGEQVWVIFESLGDSQIGYWLSRVPERDDVDDLNYTHADRRFVGEQELSTSEKAKGGTINDTTPGFPNGGGSLNTLTLAEADAYEKIISSSLAYKQFTPEVVPRYIKRPGDFVIQGSNNTLISLGQDRVGTATTATPATLTTPETVIEKFSGTIDIVAGRSISSLSHIFPQIPSPASPPINGNPQIIENTRNYYEVDKNPQLRNKAIAINEGDPNFQHDLSRIYVSMKTNGDENFHITTPNPTTDGVVHQYNSVPYIVAKSNHIRLIARKTMTGGASTIRIVKEGTLDEDQATILMESDGTVMIDGPKIIIGSGGLNKQIYLGRGATEASVLGNTLVNLLTGFLTDLEAYTSTVASSLGNLGAPIPQLNAAQATFAPKVAKLKDDLNTALSNVSRVK